MLSCKRRIMKAKVAVAILTIYLVVYVALFTAQASLTLLAVMFLASPVLLILTVFIVLMDDSSGYPELDEGEAWGYLDKNKDELGMF